MNIKKAFSNLKKFAEINLRQNNLPKQNEISLKINIDKKIEFCTLCNLLPAIKSNELFKTFMNNMSDFSFKKADSKGFLNQIELNCTFGNIQMRDGSLYDFKSLVKSKNKDVLSDNQSFQSLNFLPKKSIGKEQEILRFMVYAVQNPFYNNSSSENYENKFLTLVKVSKSYSQKPQQISYFDGFGNWLVTDFIKIIQNPESGENDCLHTVIIDNGVKNIFKNEILEIDENTFKQKPQRVWYLPEKYYTNEVPIYDYLVSKSQSERRMINPFNVMSNGKKVSFSILGASINLNDIENKLAILNSYESEVGNLDIDFDILSKK